MPLELKRQALCAYVPTMLVCSILTVFTVAPVLLVVLCTILTSIPFAKKAWQIDGPPAGMAMVIAVAITAGCAAGIIRAFLM